MTERTLVIIKPDSIKRGLSGKIISRFEDTGLKIVAIKMAWINEEHAGKHYPLDEEWAKKVFEKTSVVYEKEGKPMKYKTYQEMGKDIQKKNIDFITESPVIAIVLEGYNAIEIVRKMIGNTEPRQAVPGTIRGDFSSTESYLVADAEGRAIRTLVHASDSAENAKREISLWFKPEEVME